MEFYRCCLFVTFVVLTVDQFVGRDDECCVSMLRKLGNICCGHKMFLNKIRNMFCVPHTKFVSAKNVARAGKRGNICVGNNVSSFARASTNTTADRNMLNCASRSM